MNGATYHNAASPQGFTDNWGYFDAPVIFPAAFLEEEWPGTWHGLIFLGQIPMDWRFMAASGAKMGRLGLVLEGRVFLEKVVDGSHFFCYTKAVKLSSGYKT